MSPGGARKVHEGRGHVRDKCRALFIVARLTRSSFGDPVLSPRARSPGTVIASNVVDRVGQRHHARRRSQHVPFDHFVIFLPLPAAQRGAAPHAFRLSFSRHGTARLSSRLVSFPLPRFLPAFRTRSREEGNDVPRITKPARRT